jgi:hypothetical protein
VLTAVMVNGCSQTVESKPAVATEIESGAALASVTSFFGRD